MRGSLRGVEGAAFDLDLLAASLRADSSDVGTFVEGLASKLETVLPAHIKVERRRRGLMGPKLVRRLAVESAGERIELVRDEGDTVELRRARLSGGIVLKSETLGSEEWIAALSEVLTAEAQRSEQTRRALERLLMN
jgi:hypothetical protein